MLTDEELESFKVYSKKLGKSDTVILMGSHESIRELFKARCNAATLKHESKRQIEENKKRKKIIAKVEAKIRLYGNWNGTKCTNPIKLTIREANQLLYVLGKMRQVDAKEDEHDDMRG